MLLPHRRMIPSINPVRPGSISFLTPGTYSFQVPYHNSLLADLRGASGGGGGMSWNEGSVIQRSGGNGGNTSFVAPSGSVIGGGGLGGGVCSNLNAAYYVGADGAHGVGSGGTYNGTGDATTGGSRAFFPSAGAQFYSGLGGNGARAYRTYLKGTLTPKTLITVVVGAAGVRGAEWNGSNQDFSGFSPHSGPGVAGAAYFSWS